MQVLVTGGAGYVGSVMVEHLINQGDTPIILDDLSTGNIAATKGVKFYCGSITEPGSGLSLRRAFEENDIERVMHFCGRTTVTDSVTHPELYYSTNVGGTIELLRVMLEHGCSKIQFSSSAAVYGNGNGPTTAYGETKLAVEKMLKWYGEAHGIEYSIFRYFNVAGATETRGECHDPETHLIPSIAQVALGQKDALWVYGDDSRDYIHVSDVVRFQYDRHIGTHDVGSGCGFKTSTIIDIFENLADVEIKKISCDKRFGDPDVLVAKNEIPRDNTIVDIIRSVWEWAQKHPRGYNADR